MEACNPCLRKLGGTVVQESPSNFFDASALIPTRLNSLIASFGLSSGAVRIHGSELDSICSFILKH
jgi:hypothetical protein